MKKKKNELIEAFVNEESIVEDIVSLNMGVKKRTGERFAKATTSDGRTFIKSISKSGVEEDTLVQIPNYSTKYERNEIIKELYRKKYVQSDIADMLGLSQGTVSNILRNK